jgi:flagellum-specific peptidoglycan hydrolase FlgJ
MSIHTPDSLPAGVLHQEDEVQVSHRWMNWRRLGAAAVAVAASVSLVTYYSSEDQPAQHAVQVDGGLPSAEEIASIYSFGEVEADDDSTDDTEPAHEDAEPETSIFPRELSPMTFPAPNTESTELDHTYDFDLTGELVQLNEAQMNIINSLEIPQTERDQITTLMRGALTLRSIGLPVNAPAMVAQGRFESGSAINWTNESVATYHNFFGMKARPEVPDDKKDPFDPTEGGEQKDNIDFLIFPDATEGFEGYGEFIIQRWWFRDALGYPEDPRKYMENLLDDGGKTWCPDAGYLDTVLALIDRYRLQEIADAA